MPVRCEKRLCRAIVILENRSVYQDRLVTNIGKVERKERFVCRSARAELGGGGLSMSAFCPLFILKLIILPRQARDKHGESTQKRGPFSRLSMSTAARG